MKPVTALSSWRLNGLRLIGAVTTVVGLSAFALSPTSAFASGSLTASVTPTNVSISSTNDFVFTVTNTSSVTYGYIRIYVPSPSAILNSPDWVTGNSAYPLYSSSSTSAQYNVSLAPSASLTLHVHGIAIGNTATALWRVSGLDSGLNFQDYATGSLTINVVTATPTPTPSGGGGGGGGGSTLGASVSAINLSPNTLAWINLAYIAPLLITGLIVGFALYLLRKAIKQLSDPDHPNFKI